MCAAQHTAHAAAAKAGECRAKNLLARICAPEAQLVKKGLAEFRVRRRESSKTRFLSRHVRERKYFARSERRIVRYQRTTEAQNAAKLSRIISSHSQETAESCASWENAPRDLQHVCNAARFCFPG